MALEPKAKEEEAGPAKEETAVVKDVAESSGPEGPVEAAQSRAPKTSRASETSVGVPEGSEAKFTRESRAVLAESAK